MIAGSQCRITLKISTKTEREYEQYIVLSENTSSTSLGQNNYDYNNTVFLSDLKKLIICFISIFKLNLTFNR